MCLDHEVLVSAQGGVYRLNNRHDAVGVGGDTYTFVIPAAHPIRIFCSNLSDASVVEWTPLAPAANAPAGTTVVVNGYQFYRGRWSVAFSASAERRSMWCAHHGSMQGAERIHWRPECTTPPPPPPTLPPRSPPPSPHTPPQPPPPPPPPVAPGRAYVPGVRATLVVAGDVSSFDAPSFRAKALDAFVGVVNVVVEVSPASVVVACMFTFDTAEDASTMATFLGALTPEMVSQRLDVEVEEVRDVRVTTESLPHPSPPPPLPPPLAPPPPPQYATNAALFVVLVLAAVTSVVLIVLVSTNERPDHN